MNARPPAPQRGAFTIQFAVVLTALLSMVGLALDLSSVYARQAGMKSFAESAALAAAHELDGTSTGVDDAVERALVILNGAGGPGADDAIRANGALQFGPAPDGPWTTPDAAAGLSAEQLDRLRFARFDTSSLEGAVTEVARFFAPGEGTTSITFRESAVAGQTLLPITPLAICAMNEDPAEGRPVHGMPGTLELVEYGFRRGVTYNLLALNPHGDTPAHFVVNPVEFPEDGRSPQDKNFEPDVVRPFICSGSIMHPNSSKLYVKEDFPLELIPELNSRFKLASPCHATVAWPDKNIMEYKDVSWLNNTPVVPHAKEYAGTADGENVLQSIAERPEPQGALSGADARTRDDYGTLWAYARPVKYSSTAAGNVGEPFSKSAVPSLYPVDDADSTKWLALTWADNLAPPYIARRIGTATTPYGTSVLYRRILNIPLLQCPVSGNIGTVLGIGKFMLTSRAVDGADPYIAGEFGGLLTGARPLITRLFK